MGMQNMMDTVLRRFVIDGIGTLLQYKGKASRVVIPDKVTAIGESAFAGNDRLEAVVIPAGVIAIRDKAFQRCGRLSEVQFSRGLRRIGSSAFEHCSAIEELELPPGFREIGNNAFRSCSSLRHVSLPEGLTHIEHNAFSGCSELTEIVIPDTVTEIEGRAFQSCKKLRSAKLSKGMKVLPEYVFSECTALEEIVLPSGIRFINTGAFFGCSALESVSFPHSLVNVEWLAFQGCESLREAVFPQGLRTIGSGAFSGCIRLERVLLRTGLLNIRSEAFQGCTALHDVTLPEGLITIEDGAFRDCTSLKTLRIPEQVTEFGENCFAGTPWFQNHPGDLIVEGNGILLEYRGHAKRLELPAHVKAIHERAFPAGHTPKTLILQENAEKLGWAFIPGLELVFRRKGHSVTLALYDNYTRSGQDEKRVLQFWENKHIVRRHRAFWEIRDPVYKFPLAVLMFLSDPEDEFYADYVRRNAKDILKNMIVRNDTENLEKFLALGFVNADNIDELLDYAISNTQKTGHIEPQITLMDYKGRAIGYSDLGQIIGNAFDL